MAITDLNNLFGAIKFYREGRGKGVKPLIGAELIIEGLGTDPTAVSRVIVLVQNKQGYLNISELIARAFTQNVVKNQAVVKMAWLKELHDLLIAGEPYATNPSTLQPHDLAEIESSESATLLGHVEDMPALLRDADLVVLPSYHEGTPKILLEAGATGLPLIATDIPGCRGVVNHRRNGLLVPPKDADALTDAMRALYSCDTALRRRFGQESREIIKAGFMRHGSTVPPWRSTANWWACRQGRRCRQMPTVPSARGAGWPAPS